MLDIIQYYQITDVIQTRNTSVKSPKVRCRVQKRGRNATFFQSIRLKVLLISL